MSILPKVICKFNTSPIKIPARFLVDTDKLNPKCIWKRKVPKIAKTILQRKKKVGGISLPDFKTSCIATVNKTFVTEVDPPREHKIGAADALI